MERRTFVKNLGALLALSGIALPETIAKIDNIDSIGNLEMILRFDGKEIKSKILSGNIDYTFEKIDVSTIGDPFTEYANGRISYDVNVKLNSSDEIYDLADDLSSGWRMEMIIKLDNKEYLGTVYCRALEILQKITSIEFIGSGKLTVC